jgi:hypothetical protein
MNMQSEEINELATALSAAQGAIQGAVTDSTNPFYKSKYADIHSVITCAKEALKENGLSVVQPTEMIDGQLFLSTILLHKSGQWIKGLIPIVTDKPDAQSVGKAITYYRRYAYSSMLSISQFDDDGEEAMERKPKVEVKPTEPPSMDSFVIALAKVDTHIDKAHLAPFLAEFAASTGYTVEAVIKSAIANPEKLGRLKEKIDEFMKTKLAKPSKS